LAELGFGHAQIREAVDFFEETLLRMAFGTSLEAGEHDVSGGTVGLGHAAGEARHMSPDILAGFPELSFLGISFEKSGSEPERGAE